MREHLSHDEYEVLESVSRCQGCFTGQFPDKEISRLSSLGLVERRYEGPAAMFGLNKIYLTGKGADVL